MNIPDFVLHPTAEAQLEAFTAQPSHAVLLAGPAGSGKTHIAAALAARLLNVPNLEAYAHYRVISPQKGSIAIEQVRGLIGFFRLKAPGSAAIRRAAVIQDADCLGIEAQNALLKILEEPPEDSVLILTSSQPQNLLPTIRSRVQMLQLAAPSSAALTKHFEELGHDPAAVGGALMRAGTDIAGAARLLTEDGAADSSIELVKKALGSSSYDRLLLVDGLARQKDTAAGFVSTLATVSAASLEAAARKGTGTIDRWSSILQAAHIAEDALARSGNAKLVLTELMLAM